MFSLSFLRNFFCTLVLSSFLLFFVAFFRIFFIYFLPSSFLLYIFFTSSFLSFCNENCFTFPYVYMKVQSFSQIIVPARIYDGWYAYRNPDASHILQLIYPFFTNVFSTISSCFHKKFYILIFNGLSVYFRHSP